MHGDRKGRALQIEAVRWVVNDSVVSAELDDEAVLLDVESGIYFGLVGIGTQIWQLLEQGVSEVEMTRLLLEEYEVEEPRLRADVANFLAGLERQGLIRVEGDTDASSRS
jgi:hypothetical protein